MVNKIKEKKTTLRVNRGEKIVLYFEPRAKKDVLGRIKYTGKLHTTYLDKNTLLVTMPNKHSVSTYSLKGRRAYRKRGENDNSLPTPLNHSINSCLRYTQKLWGI